MIRSRSAEPFSMVPPTSRSCSVRAPKNAFIIVPLFWSLECGGESAATRGSTPHGSAGDVGVRRSAAHHSAAASIDPGDRAVSAEHLESTPTPEADPRRRTVLAALSVVLGVLGAVWSVVATALMIDIARITYYLPTPDQAGATEHHDWHLPALLPTPLGALALLLAATGIALGGWGLVRRRGVRGWVLVLPCVALLLATAALTITAAIPQSTATY